MESALINNYYRLACALVSLLKRRDGRRALESFALLMMAALLIDINATRRVD